MSMLYFFGRLFPIIYIIFFSISLVKGQLIVTSQKSIEIAPKQYKTGMVAADINGIAVLHEGINKQADSKKEIRVEVLDSRLTTKANLQLSVPHNANLAYRLHTNNSLYLIYNQLVSEEIFAYKIDLRDLSITHAVFYSIPQVRYYDAAVIGSQFVLAGAKGKKGILLHLDFEETSSKVSYFTQNNVSAFAQHLFTYNKKLYVTLKSSDHRDDKLYYQVFNGSGSLLEKGKLEGASNLKLLEAQFQANTENEVVAIGTYSLKKSVHPAGFFVTELSKSPVYFPLSSLNNTASLQLTSKKGIKETKQYLKLNSIAKNNKSWSILAESYEIVPESKKTYAQRLLPHPQNSFLQLWAVNNLNYHDYNMHIFEKRMLESAAYQSNGLHLFSLDNRVLNMIDLKIPKETTCKSFGYITSSISVNGDLKVLNTLNGELNNVSLQSKNTTYFDKVMDRDGNSIDLATTEAFFWSENQYVFIARDDNNAITLYKVKDFN